MSDIFEKAARAEQLEGLGRHQEAIDKFLELIGEGVDSYVWQKIARNYFELNNYEKAEAAAKSCLELHANNSSALISLGLVKIKQRKFNESETYLKQCLATEPENVEAIFYLIQVYVNEKRLDEARIFLDRGLAIQPDDFDLKKCRMLLRAMSGDSLGTNQEINEVLAQDPNEADTLAMKAAMLLNDSKFEAAEQCALNSLAVNPNGVMAKKILLQVLKNKYFLLRFFAGRGFKQVKMEWTFWSVLIAIIAFKGVLLWGGFFVLYMLITWAGSVIFNTIARFRPRLSILLDQNDINQSNLFVLGISIVSMMLMAYHFIEADFFVKLAVGSAVLTFFGISIFEFRIGRRKVLIGVAILATMLLLVFSQLHVLVFSIWATLLLIIHGFLFTFCIYGRSA